MQHNRNKIMNRDDIQVRAASFEKLTEQLTLVRKQNTLIEQLEQLGVHADDIEPRPDESELERQRLSAYVKMITEFNSRPKENAI